MLLKMEVQSWRTRSQPSASISRFSRAYSDSQPRIAACKYRPAQCSTTCVCESERAGGRKLALLKEAPEEKPVTDSKGGRIIPLINKNFSTKRKWAPRSGINTSLADCLADLKKWRARTRTTKTESIQASLAWSLTDTKVHHACKFGLWKRKSVFYKRQIKREACVRVRVYVCACVCVRVCTYACTRLQK